VMGCNIKSCKTAERDPTRTPPGRARDGCRRLFAGSRAGPAAKGARDKALLSLATPSASAGSEV